MSKVISIETVTQLADDNWMAQIVVPVEDRIDGEPREHFVKINFRFKYAGPGNDKRLYRAAQSQAKEVIETVRAVLQHNDLFDHL